MEAVEKKHVETVEALLTQVCTWRQSASQKTLA